MWSSSWQVFGIQYYECEHDGKIIYQPVPCGGAPKLPPQLKQYTNEQDLIVFSRQGQEALVYKLLAQGVSPNAIDEDNKSSLFYALEQQHYNIARLLIASNADVNQILPSGLNLVMFFTNKDDKQAVQLLLTSNTNLEYKSVQDGNTALLLAIMANKTNVAKLLLRAGANPNIINNNGITPIIAALENKSEKIVNLLYRYKANVDQLSKPLDKDLSATPLLHFATMGDDTAVFTLLNLGADVNIVNEKNISPLTAAALVGHLSIVQALLTAGANPKLLTAEPQLWEYVKNKSNPQIAKLIEEKEY